METDPIKILDECIEHADSMRTALAEIERCGAAMLEAQARLQQALGLDPTTATDTTIDQPPTTET